MALYIVFQSGEELQWNVGQKNPVPTDREISMIKFIQADGHELDAIKLLFTTNEKRHPLDQRITIPFAYDKRVVKWYGDVAKTIVANLF